MTLIQKGQKNFLQFNGREVLNHLGKISNEIAKELAQKEYEK